MSDFRPDLFFFFFNQIRKDRLVIDNFNNFRSSAGLYPGGFSFTAIFEPDELMRLSYKCKPFYNRNDMTVNLSSCKDFLMQKCSSEIDEELQIALNYHESFNSSPTHKIDADGNTVKIKLGQGVEQRTFFGIILNGLIFHYDSEKIAHMTQMNIKMGKNGLLVLLQSYVAALKALCQTILKYDDILRIVVPTGHLDTPDVNTLRLLHDWNTVQEEQRLH